MSSEEMGLKLSMLEELERLRLLQRERNKDIFIPGEPEKKPFLQQIQFFSCVSHIKMARCGNRAGKTFTTMRDLAWKLMRNHPYVKKWREDYISSAPKEFWAIGPDYTFCNEVMWDRYLSQFIPEWFYYDPISNKPMIEKTNQGNIDCVRFRNGDSLKFKSYDQNLASLMGKAVDHVTLDEMPRNVKLIGELITRTLDLDGEVCLGFTPLNPVEEIEKLIEENKKIIVFQWSLRDNPHYKENPERLQRALDAWKHLPKSERESRESGEWYRERLHGRVFAGLDLDMVDDFEIPFHWRQVRFTDPAARVTGLAIFAEDPESSVWYCHTGVEIQWQDQRAKAEEIVKEIERKKPFPEFSYYLSRYDNHEAWFGAYGAEVGFTPCILKNREAAQMEIRSAVASGKLKFFKKGAALAKKQFDEYHYKDNGIINKINDHVLDCVMYFCREIPAPLPFHTQDTNRSMKQELWANHLKKKEEAAKLRENFADPTRNMPRFGRAGSLASLHSRRSR